MPDGSTSTGRRADGNGRQQREHRSGREWHPSAATVGPETPHAASGQHERTPFVTSPPSPYGRELSVPETWRALAEHIDHAAANSGNFPIGGRL